MKYLQGKNRTQINLFPVSIDQAIDQDNETRIIDLFVDSLPLKEYGFRVDFVENGRPAYHSADLLKLYIYSYLNQIRSSRKIEKECSRNIELMWLLKGLVPDHNTISNFRKNNPDSIRKVFETSVAVAKYFHLIGKKLIAGDSTKLRAQNSKKNNYNQGKINRHLEYIDNKLNEYNQELSAEDCDNTEHIKKEIYKHQQRKEKYQQLEQQLKDTGEEQISTTDPESRQMITRNNITEVAYNVQTSVDAEHNLLIDYLVTNNNDSKAMGNMLKRATEILATTEFTALYDKGYHTGSELKTGQDLNINLLVAIPDVASNAPDTKYNVSNFQYDKQNDNYICPENHVLTTNGNWYSKNRGHHRSEVQVKHYNTKHCKNCLVRQQCTTNKKGRLIERSQYAENIEKNKQNMAINKTLYKRRQAIVEHPYGTIKRQWGFNYIITKKSKQRASSDVGLIFVAYNLRRLINILGYNVLKDYLKALVVLVFQKTSIWKLSYLRNASTKISQNLLPSYFAPPLKNLKLARNLIVNGGY